MFHILIFRLVFFFYVRVVFLFPQCKLEYSHCGNDEYGIDGKHIYCCNNFDGATYVEYCSSNDIRHYLCNDTCQLDYVENFKCVEGEEFCITYSLTYQENKKENIVECGKGNFSLSFMCPHTPDIMPAPYDGVFCFKTVSPLSGINHEKNMWKLKCDENGVVKWNRRTWKCNVGCYFKVSKHGNSYVDCPRPGCDYGNVCNSYNLVKVNNETEIIPNRPYCCDNKFNWYTMEYQDNFYGFNYLSVECDEELIVKKSDRCSKDDGWKWAWNGKEYDENCNNENGKCKLKRDHTILKGVVYSGCAIATVICSVVLVVVFSYYCYKNNEKVESIFRERGKKGNGLKNIFFSFSIIFSIFVICYGTIVGVVHLLPSFIFFGTDWWWVSLLGHIVAFIVVCAAVVYLVLIFTDKKKIPFVLCSLYSVASIFGLIFFVASVIALLIILPILFGVLIFIPIVMFGMCLCPFFVCTIVNAVCSTSLNGCLYKLIVEDKKKRERIQIVDVESDKEVDSVDVFHSQLVDQPQQQQINLEEKVEPRYQVVDVDVDPTT